MDDIRHSRTRSTSRRANLTSPWALAQKLEQPLQARLRRSSHPMELQVEGLVPADLSWLVGQTDSQTLPRARGQAPRPTAAAVASVLSRLDQAPVLPAALLLAGASWCLRAVAGFEHRTSRDKAQAWDLVGRSASLAAAGWARLGQLEEARWLLRTAWAAASRGSRSRALRSAILRRQARLFGVEGDLARAQRILLRLAESHQRAGERWAYFLALASLGNIFTHFGCTDEALAAVALSIHQLDPEEMPHHFRQATLQLAWCCFEAGQADRAREALSCFRDQALGSEARFIPLESRATWLAARLAQHDGQLDFAEQRLHEAAEGYLGVGGVLPYCQVTLERMLLLLRRGRAQEILSLVAPVLTLLRQHHCPEHRIAAVILVRKAAAAGQATEHLIRAALRALSLPPPRRRG